MVSLLPVGLDTAEDHRLLDQPTIFETNHQVVVIGNKQMCDTLIATKLTTADGKAIFAKNSDRPVNEAQYILQILPQKHPAGSSVRCTYIDIPQVQETHGVLISKPFWMWGAEMGVNDHGVVIGNEAIFSKIPANKKPALLGMDLLRLALERAGTARAATLVIIDLLEQYGQGGNCTHDHETYYHNSFIIADVNDAWVLETVDQQWAARQVTDVYSISNCLTIHDQYDLASRDLVGAAVEKGWVKSAQSFDYAKDYSDFIYTKFSKGLDRRETTIGLLEKNKGALTVGSMMRALRDHHYDPQKGFADVDVCMHAGWGPIRISQTTASMVVYLDHDRPTVFATGTAAPCTSIFKPLWIDASLSDPGPTPVDQYDSASLFWSHERLHRATLLNYPERIQTYATDRDALEEKFIQEALELANASTKDRAAFTAECLRQAAVAETDWLARVEKVPAKKSGLNSSAWNKFNLMAKMPVIK